MIKKLLLSALILGLFFTATAAGNNDLVGVWKSTPVVFGLNSDQMDMSMDVCYDITSPKTVSAIYTFSGGMKGVRVIFTLSGNGSYAFQDGTMSVDIENITDDIKFGTTQGDDKTIASETQDSFLYDLCKIWGEALKNFVQHVEISDVKTDGSSMSGIIFKKLDIKLNKETK